LFLLGAIPAHASPPSPSNPAGHILGVVPAHGHASSQRSGGSNLTYHNGPVEIGVHHTFAIYWNPSNVYSYSTSYQSIINGFFQNVAGGSGSTSNVYDSDTQYYNSARTHISYSESFGGAISDSSAAGNGCSSRAGGSLCVNDGQIQQEVQRVVKNSNLPVGTTDEYFVFLPNGVSSCYGGSSCAFSQFCAYHSNTSAGNGTTSGTVLYANMPYTGHNLSACGSGNSPNGDAAADSTINVTSHEANESITDPLGTAWYDRSGYENGDKCAWNFGSYSGNYNQTIDGGHYFLQQEWSNHSSGCVLQRT